MTDAHLWATVALAAILGCGFLLYMMARTILPNANAMKVLHEIDARFDERVRSILHKATDLKKKEAPQPIAGVAPPQGQMPTNPLEQLFPGSRIFEPITEQPEAAEGLEIHGA